MPVKPSPPPSADSKPFRDGCAVRELRYQRCGHCGKAQFPPAKLCRACNSEHLEWEASGGFGTIHSFTTVYRGPSAAFKDDCPYVLALVNMDEGFRIMVNVLGLDASSTSIDQRVGIIFESRDGNVVLPQCELVDE